MRVGSLFSGIGGLDLGLERAGMTVAWQSEIEPYASRVLAKHWPNVPNLGDITRIDWNTVERPDLICGGYPCQPFSLAGVRRGESDPRHLWPHFHRAIRHLRPRYALLENVPGHLSMGFGRVLGDLAEIGYDVEWFSIPAAAVGAPHLRWRLFAIARRPEQRRILADAGSGRRQNDGLRAGRDEPRLCGANVADTERLAVGTGLCEGGARGQRRGRSGDVDSTGDAWAVEPDVGRVAHGIPHRMDRLRCLGNAVVPQVAEHIGRRIMNSETEKTMTDINTAAEAMTGEWLKLTRKEHGTVEGRVISFETRPMTFEGAPVLNRKTGAPRTEWVLVVLTDAGETVKLSLKESGQRAIAQAIKDSGQPAKNGDRIKIAVKEDPADERSQATYQVRWTADSTPLNIPTTADDTEEEPF